MLRTAMNAGINPIGKDKAARLLAICFFFGSEDFVYNKKLATDIMTVAEIYGCSGACIADPELAQKLKLYVNDIKRYYTKDVAVTDYDMANTYVTVTRDKKPGKPKWLADIEDEYGMSFPKD